MKPYYQNNDITIYNGDCQEILTTLPDLTIDSVITDPPYLYLKEDFDRKFDEKIVFKNLHRVSKKDSTLCFFGRGSVFHKWSCVASNYFVFKEELAWDKAAGSSPFGSVQRQHENIIVMSKGNKKLNKVYINKIEYDELSGEHQKTKIDLNRIISGLKNIKSLEDLESFKAGMFNIREKRSKHKITGESSYNRDKAFNTYQSYEKGKLLSSIIRVAREHYQFEHPTQKPIELMNILCKLCSNESDTIIDPFTGSGSTLVSALINKRKAIGIELSEEYCEIAAKRIEKEMDKMQSRLF